MKETSFSYLLNELQVLSRNINLFHDYEIDGCTTTISILKNKNKPINTYRFCHELICYGAKNVRLVENLTLSNTSPFVLYKPSRVILRVLIFAYHMVLRVIKFLSILNRSSIFIRTRANLSCYRILSIYVGTAAPSRKIILLIEDGNSKEVLKYGSSVRSQRSLKHEYQTLLFLFDTKISKYIPQTKIITLDNDQVATLTRYIPNTRNNYNYNTLVEEFLTDLSQINFSSSELKIETFLEDKFRDSENLLLNDLVDKFRLTETSLSSHLSHGDFADWNIRVQNDSLTVLDWEYAVASAPLGFDLFYFHFSRDLTTGRMSKNVKRKMQTVSTHFDKIYNKLAVRYDFELYFSLWLLSLERNEKNQSVIKSLMESMLDDGF